MHGTKSLVPNILFFGTISEASLLKTLKQIWNWRPYSFLVLKILLQTHSSISSIIIFRVCYFLCVCTYNSEWWEDLNTECVLLICWSFSLVWVILLMIKVVPKGIPKHFHKYNTQEYWYSEHCKGYAVYSMITKNRKKPIKIRQSVI